MDYQVIKFKIEDGIAYMHINRPEAFNAVNEQVLIETSHALNAVTKDETVKAVILGEEGPFFVAGADIKEVIDHNLVQAERYITMAQNVLSRLSRLPLPTVAAISGLALGGGLEMTLHCDVRIAAENAMFGLPEINLGIVPACGGTQILPRLVGMGRAKDIILLGEIFDAQKALEYGVVSKVVPAEDLMKEAKKIAAKLMRKPPVALRMAKQLVGISMDMDLVNGMAAERTAFAMLFSTADQKEGMNAFLQGRKPQFRGE